MRFGNKKLSTRTLALTVAAVLLFACGSVMFAKAALNIRSGNLDETFELDHVYVNLLENEKNVNGSGDEAGVLLGSIDKIVPGIVYKEVIAAQNATGEGTVDAVDQYMRIILKKYWINPDGTKDTTMDPSLIHIGYGDKDYNEGPWQINEEETTAEQTVYYYTKKLAGQEVTEPLIDHLQMDTSVATDISDTNLIPSQDGDVYKYTYRYDGKTICLEADVQVLQPHNINDAIKSSWGVENVSVSGGVLTVQGD